LIWEPTLRMQDPDGIATERTHRTDQ